MQTTWLRINSYNMRQPNGVRPPPDLQTLTYMHVNKPSPWGGALNCGRLNQPSGAELEGSKIIHAYIVPG